MGATNSHALQRLARAHGIQTSYVDNAGQKQVASDETLRLILDRLEVEEDAPLLQPIEPVIVRWQKKRSKMLLRSGADQLRDALLSLALEDGEVEVMPLRELLRGRKPGRSGEIAELELDLPELPVGYHELTLETDSGRHRSLIISAPEKLYAEQGRDWGAFLPLYAAHSEQSWGAGNFTDFKRLAEWIGSMGGRVAGALPLLSTFLDQPVCEPSPYSPASRFFWNEFFLDITAIPEFGASAAARKLAGSPPIRRKLQAFRAADFIDYRKEWEVRRKVLEVLAREFFSGRSPRRSEFQAYLRDRPEARVYAEFRAACDAQESSWHNWRAAARNGRLGRKDYDPAVRDFYLYAQWNAQQQIEALQRESGAAGVKFYLDLPLGVNPDGFDSWRYREFFAQGVSAGAPPDSFFTKGQDWGFAPLHPRRMREQHYRYVIQYLRFQMRHTGLLRIDHVMGLHRLWWVPHGQPATAGAYVSYPADEFYAILSVESHRHETTLVGENLGTVPAEVNKGMDRHGIRRMYVLQYEQQPEGPLRPPEERVVASLNTHDMPTFAAHWKGLDIADRYQLRLISRKEIAGEKRHRERLRKNLIRFLRREKLLPARGGGDIHKAVQIFLATSPAETVLVNLEDLWGEVRSQNVPGTSSERPNWRRKAARTLEQMEADRSVEEFLQILTLARRDSAKRQRDRR